MSAREIYDSTIRRLPAIDRLRLASMILDDLAASQGKDLDLSDEWSDEDISDLSAATLKHAAATLEDSDA